MLVRAYVACLLENSVTSKVLKSGSTGKKRRGRPKEKFTEVVENELERMNVRN